MVPFGDTAPERPQTGSESFMPYGFVRFRASRQFVVASLIAIAVLCLGRAPAEAVELSLGGDQFWVVLVSRQDADHAIAGAQRYAAAKPIVVRSANGWFAAVSGPHTIRSGLGRQFLEAQIKEQRAPKDAYLTKGANFVESVWAQPASNIEDTLQYDGEHDAAFRKDDLEIKLTRHSVGDGEADAVAIGTYKGKPAFNMEFTENPTDTPASQVQLVRLDPNSPMPQVVFTYFWKGAHCCTITKIATLTKEGTWHVVDGDTIDGDGGYQFEDLENKGFSYLISIDQSFLYAFDSYAGSYSPSRIHQLSGDTLVDVATDAKFQHTLLQSLYLQEEYAGDGDDSWHSNGFLAGWVASSILVGRGDAAWSKMLASYDHQSDFSQEKCTTNAPIDKCPDDKKVKLAFPAALRAFLAEHGYISDISRFSVPYEVEPASPTPLSQPAVIAKPINSNLKACVDQSDLVRKLIYQTFADRKTYAGESYESVSLHNDATLEGYDANIGKVTCAVTYEIILTKLIGRLAEDGNFRRAEALNRLSRRSGGVVSTRVRFTVKPTATPGNVFVELMQ